MKRSGQWLAMLAVCLLGALPSCAKRPAKTAEAPSGPRRLVLPAQGLYTGAYIDFGEREDTVTLEAIEGFEKMVGKQQAIVASSSYWGEQSFPTANVNLIWRHGSIPLVFWSPWDRPYEEDRGPDRFSLTSIVEGKWDAYLDAWGDAARAFGQPLLVSFGNEANGSWFPWSGAFYGGEKPVPGSEPKRYEGPETFKKAYRHVVDRVRARGAVNVQWVFHVMNYSIPMDTWNLADQYYPGPDYVDWLGLSVYGQQFAGDPWSPFPPLLEWPYKELGMLDPNKPIMVAEWGVGEFPQTGDKARFISDAFAMMKTCPRLKAAVFWHERWQNDDESYSNLRVNSSPEALAAYRRGVADPAYLARPILGPAGPGR
jgi:hypothetical protein